MLVRFEGTENSLHTNILSNLILYLKNERKRSSFLFEQYLTFVEKRKRLI